MNEGKTYDVCIVGGGLGGLALSIQMAREGFTVALFEKEKYPFHKVCGEYISLESWNFLEELGVPLSDLKLPLISKLIVTAPGGKALHQELPLGGFGISRYTLDNMLQHIAIENKVDVFDDCKVSEIQFNNDEFTIQSANGICKSVVCCGSFGKRSNLDVKWKRRFIAEKPGKLNNYIGIKYHISTDFPADTIALHNFENGYCGISKIENNKYCLCYLTSAGNLKTSNNSIAEMEKNILHQNPHLQQIFTNAEFLYKSPVTISQVSFNKKTQVENHCLMIGDAAGLITPLCGNGMSMALHGSKIAAKLITTFLQGKIERQKMESDYSKAWKKNFAYRLLAGRLIQKMFGKIWITNLFVSFMKKTPVLTKRLIRKTHGDTF